MWIYRGAEYNPTAEELEGFHGFVYIIEHAKTGRKYIGKKLFWFKTRKNVALKNGKKRKKRILVESDWRAYYGSSEQFLHEVATNGTEQYRREILHLCRSKAECSYLEAYEQFIRRALLDPMYANKWIMVRVRAEHLKNLVDSPPITV